MEMAGGAMAEGHVRGGAGVNETQCSAAAQLFDRPDLARRTADGDRDATERGRGRQDDLDALARGKGRRQERRRLIHSLAGRVGHELRQPQAPVEVRERSGHAAPAGTRLEEHLSGPIDAKLGDVRVREQRTQRLEREFERGRRGRRAAARLRAREL